MSNLNRHPVRRTAAGVLAGALAFSGAFAAGTPAFAGPGFSLDRIAGADRYATSAAIAAEFGAADGAILASGETGRSVDALGASFLAGIRQDPVLLTARDSVPAPILTRLNALTAKNVTIVGGTAAVSTAVENQLRTAGFTVTRLGGKDRFETSELIVKAGVAEGDESKVGLVASGLSPVDALAGGPLAYKGRHPIFLTAGATIPQDTIDAMVAAGTTSVIILGGTTVVPTSIETQLAARGITVVTRLGGVDRSATSRLIADYLIANHGFTSTTFNVASGANAGVDALGGAALSGKENRALLVTNTATDAGSVDDFATARTATLTAAGHIFGGLAVITQAVETAIETAGVGTAAASATTLPELRTATIVSTTTSVQANADNPLGTVVRFTFDENVLSANAGQFRLVGSNGTDVATGTGVVSVSGNTVTVRFGTVNATTGTTAANVSNYTLATVLAGAATDAQGSQSPEGDAAIGTAASTTTTAVANTTSAPDLRSVSGFRAANPDAGAGGAANSTAVDFVFDQAAFVTAGASFNLVRTTGEIITCTAPPAASTRAGGGTVSGGNGTTTVTVICPNIGGGTTALVAGDIARAYVGATSVADTQANATTTGTNDNPLQSVPVSNNGVTTTVDLVSAQFVAANSTGNATSNDQVVYTFDQETPATFDDNVFRVFFSNGDSATGTVGTRSADGLRVLVNFVGTQLTDAVGASVGLQTGGATSVQLRPASVGVAPVRSGTSARTPGQVDAPELRSVAISTSTNALNVVSTTATYTFDQAINPGSIVANNFRLYNSDGNLLTGQTCAPPANATASNTQVVCTLFSGTFTAPATIQTTAAAATLGTVLPGAVTGATGSTNTNPNPAGAEFTTGGTGTRA